MLKHRVHVIGELVIYSVYVIIDSIYGININYVILCKNYKYIINIIDINLKHA